MANQVKVVTEGDIGAGLKVENGELVVAVDGVTIKVVGNQLVATTQVELHVTDVSADKETGKLKVTVSDGQGGNVQTIETTLADLIAVSKNPDNLAEARSDGIYVGKAAIKEIVAEEAKKGAEVQFQNLAGNDIGYAFENNA